MKHKNIRFKFVSTLSCVITKPKQKPIMKKILLGLAMMAIGHCVSAQTILIKNMSSTTVHFVVHYTTSTNLCTISAPQTQVLSLTSGAHVTYSPANPAPGSVSAAYYNGIRFFDQPDPSCSGAIGYDVGIPCFFPYQTQTECIASSCGGTCTSVTVTYSSTNPTNPIVTFQ
jgi:hypothetical protein